MRKPIYLLDKEMEAVIEGLQLLKGMRTADANSAGELTEDYYFRDRQLYDEATEAEQSAAIELLDIDDLISTFKDSLKEAK